MIQARVSEALIDTDSSGHDYCHYIVSLGTHGSRTDRPPAPVSRDTPFILVGLRQADPLNVHGINEHLQVNIPPICNVDMESHVQMRRLQEDSEAITFNMSSLTCHDDRQYARSKNFHRPNSPKGSHDFPAFSYPS